jgi:hypothetical protein
MAKARMRPFAETANAARSGIIGSVSESLTVRGGVDYISQLEAACSRYDVLQQAVRHNQVVTLHGEAAGVSDHEFDPLLGGGEIRTDVDHRNVIRPLGRSAPELRRAPKVEDAHCAEVWEPARSSCQRLARSRAEMDLGLVGSMTRSRIVRIA